MHNLLIVDDEVVLAEGLAGDVDWSPSGVQEVFVAESGEQACAILEEHRIDIVLTDILMPGMDGIALAREVRERWPLARVIFLSGYDEFEYAQKAVGLAVFRYLMKPVGDDEILECVRQAGESINREMNEVVHLHDLEERVAEYLPRVRGRYLQLWMEGRRGDALERTPLLEQFGLSDLPESVVFVIVVRRERWLIESRHRDTAYELGIRKLTSRVLLHDRDAPSFMDENDDLILVVRSHDPESLNAARAYATKMAESLQGATRMSLGAVVSVIVGPVVRPEQVPDTYKGLRDMFREAHFGLEGVVRNVDSLPVSRPVAALKALSRPIGIAHHVDSLQDADALECLEETFDEIARAGNVSNETLLAVYCRVVDSLLSASAGRSIPVESWIDDPRRIRFSFDRIRSVHELRDWCERNVTLFIRAAREHEDGRSSAIVRQAKTLVVENLDGDISVARIAAVMELHPNHISSVFSRTEGVTLSEYITAQRMDAARRLLRSPGIKVYEVAERVGYQSVAHFNRTFKRCVGMSPKRFQLSG